MLSGPLRARLLGCCGASLLLCACEQLGMTDQPPVPSVEAVTPGDPEPVAAIADADVIKDPVVPAPADWDGTGILKPTTAEDTRGAPSWTNIEAEVVDRDGTRYLLATGVASGIDNPSLAEKTAENRARHVLARYLDKSRLVNSHIVGTWQDASTGTVYARAEIEVPPTFMPKNLPAPRK